MVRRNTTIIVFQLLAVAGWQTHSLSAFLPLLFEPTNQQRSTSTTTRNTAVGARRCSTARMAGAAGGQGGGDNSGGVGGDVKKTYDSEAVSPRKDVISMETAMREFFEGGPAEQDWKPLFRALLSPSIDDDALVRTWLSLEDDADDDGDDDSQQPPQESSEGVFEFHETSQPWRRLEGIPTSDGDRAVLADFLDQVQASLIAIPVDESTEEDDEFDLQFLEEGRRMLVCGRFHVVGTAEASTATATAAADDSASSSSSSRSSSSRIDHLDSLFGVCWNEIFHLHEEGEADTGSLIVVPGSEWTDVRRFVDMQLQRPLQWLGLQDVFEVTSLERGSPAIRVIHKLSDMPTDLPDQVETMGGGGDADGDDDSSDDE